MGDASEVLFSEAPESLKRGWQIRQDNFGGRISFFAPSLKRYTTEEFSQECSCSFAPVSITGSACALMCDHCQARILRAMTPALTPRSLLAEATRLKAAGARGMLVSGGSGRDGVVPLSGFLGVIGEIRERLGLTVLVHTGITGRKLARGLAAAGVDAAMIDIIGADRTVRGVCHLDGACAADYERSLANLCEAGVAVSPHVVIGLDFGVLAGEMQALETISRYPVSSLVLVGLVPQLGTPMEGVAVPAPGRFGELFLIARELLPRTPVMLGCERPAGDHKVETDRLALAAGLNGIAYPAEGIIELARETGLEVSLSEMCCAVGSPV